MAKMTQWLRAISQRMKVGLQQVYPFDVQSRLEQKVVEKTAESALNAPANMTQDGMSHTQAELALKGYEQLLHSILDNTSTFIIAKEYRQTGGQYLLVNKSYAQLFNTSPETLKGKKVYDLYSAEIAHRLDEDDRWVYESGQSRQIEEEIIIAGNRHIVVSNKFTLRDLDGVPYGMCIIATDLTQRKEEEEVLYRNEALLKTTNQIARIGGWELDIEANELYWTDTIKEIHEVPLEYVPNLTEGINFYAPEYVPVIRAAVEGAMVGRPYDMELQIITAKQNRLWVRAIGQPVYENGRIVKLLGVFQDIHAQKLVNDALRRSETLLNATNQLARTGGWELDLRTNELYWTDSIKEIHEVPPDYMPQLTKAIHFYAPEYVPVIQTAVQEAMAGQPYDLELQLITAKQNRLWVRTIGQPVYENGQVVKLFGIFQDIHPRKLADEALHVSEANLREAQRLAHLGNFEFDLQTQQVRWSEEVYRIFEKEINSPITLEMYQTSLPPADFQRVMAAVEQSAQTLKPYEIEHDVVVSDGRHKHVFALGRPMTNTSGQVTHIFGIVQDITDRKLAEDALRQSETNLREAQQIARLGNFELDLLSGEVRWSEEVYRMFGVEPGHPITLAQFQSFLAPEDLQRMTDTITNTIHTEQASTFEYRVKLYSGEEKYIFAIGRPILDEAGQVRYIFGIVQDITQRKQAEIALQESESLYRALFEQSYDGVILHDAATGKVVAANQALANMLECEVADLIGSSSTDDVPPDEVEDSRDRWQRTLTEGHLPAYERRLITHKGQERYFEITTSAIYGNRATPVRLMQAVLRDITERKQTEERIQTSLREKEVLLKEIHHRVKNNLQVISSLLDLQSSYIKDESVREMFQESRSRVRSMALVHEQLYQSADLARIDFAGYVDNLTGYLLRVYGHLAWNVRLQVDIVELSLSVETAVPFGLIINELVSNALKHAFPNGRSGQILIQLQPVADNRITLTVQDDGIGLPKGITMKNSPSLGLTIVTTLVKQLDGRATLTSDNGTRFEMIFPTEDQRFKERSATD